MALALGAFAFSANAQVELFDDIENYTFGDISGQASHWRTWSGNPTPEESADVSADQALSGAFSMLVDGVGAPAGIDQLLLIESQPDSGLYTVQFSMYVPTGNEGFFNTQGLITEPQGGSFLTTDIYFNRAGGSPGVGDIGNGAVTWPFPHDEWFSVNLVYDLDNQTWSMDVAGAPAVTDRPFNDTSVPYLGGIDFYAPSTTTTYYIDDITLAQGILGVDDFAKEVFSVYPNPVKDVLNIQSKANVESVVIYDILGKVVLSTRPDAVSPAIDMSGLTSGAYMVNVTIDGTSKTVKVIK